MMNNNLLVSRLIAKVAPPSEPGAPLPDIPEIRNPALSGRIRWLTGTQFLNVFLPNLIGAFFVGAIIVDFFVLMIAGIRWITAGGNQEQLARAKDALRNGLIGLVVVLSVFAILKLLEEFLGIGLLTIDFSALFLK